MDASRTRQQLADRSRAVLVTRKADGALQTSPVLVVLDDEDRLCISSRETAYKVRNLRRNDAATLCVLPDDFFGHWLQVDGRATVVSLPDAMEPLVDYYRRASGEHPDWADYRAAMERERRVLIRVSVDHVGPSRSG